MSVISFVREMQKKKEKDSKEKEKRAIIASKFHPPIAPAIGNLRNGHIVKVEKTYLTSH